MPRKAAARGKRKPSAPAPPRPKTSDAKASERRRVRRRNIPFMRSAILEVDGRSHIVVLSDLGPDGAFLSTRAPVAPQRSLRLKVILPRDGRQVVLPCELVWKNDRFDPATGRPAGIAVRFEGLDSDIERRVEEFAIQGFRPSPTPAPVEHFEYRVVERNGVDARELNLFGLDGWRVVTSIQTAAGVQLVLMRRL